VRIYHVVPGPVSAAATTVIEVVADWVCTGFPLSVTVAVKLDTPVTDAVPEIVPVVAARVNPAGRLPEVIDHVYAGVPPLARKACEYAVPLVPEGKVDEVMVRGLAAVLTIVNVADCV
jgi:hypothetical protein